MFQRALYIHHLILDLLICAKLRGPEDHGFPANTTIQIFLGIRCLLLYGVHMNRQNWKNPPTAPQNTPLEVTRFVASRGDPLLIPFAEVVSTPLIPSPSWRGATLAHDCLRLSARSGPRAPQAQSKKTIPGSIFGLSGVAGTDQRLKYSGISCLPGTVGPEQGPIVGNCRTLRRRRPGKCSGVYFRPGGPRQVSRQGGIPPTPLRALAPAPLPHLVGWGAPTPSPQLSK